MTNIFPKKSFDGDESHGIELVKKHLKNKQKLWIKPIIYLISPFQPDKFLNPSGPDISLKNTNPGRPYWDPTGFWQQKTTQRSPFFFERNFSSVFFHRDVLLAGSTNPFQK